MRKWVYNLPVIIISYDNTNNGSESMTHYYRSSNWVYNDLMILARCITKAAIRELCCLAAGLFHCSFQEKTWVQRVVIGLDLIPTDKQILALPTFLSVHNRALLLLQNWSVIAIVYIPLYYQNQYFVIKYRKHNLKIGLY